MADNKTISERRRHPRFRVKEGAFAVISPYPRKLGQIIDISIGGLLFEYIDSQNEKDTTKEKAIFLSSLHRYVSDLQFKTIEDFVAKDHPSFSSLKMRKRRVEFDNLSFIQLLELDCFLKANATDGFEGIDLMSPGH